MITSTDNLFISTDKEGTVRVFNKDVELHCETAPAVEFANGDKMSYLNGLRHRLDGPACDYANGHKEWWQNGKLHRVDGPAVISSNGDKQWWLLGDQLSYHE